MTSMIKKYLPYAIIIFAVFLLVPLIFISEPMQKFSAVGYYFILLMTQVVCSAVYCAKHGLDFLFTLIAPIAFLFTMMIYAGGFSNITNIILLVVYLIAGIFGLFLGDLAFGDARRKQEKKEKQAAEELLLQAKRRDEREKQKMAEQSERPRRREAASHSQRSSRGSRNAHSSRGSHVARTADRAPRASEKRASSPRDIDDDFDYDKYMSDIDRMLDETDRENRDLDY